MIHSDSNFFLAGPVESTIAYRIGNDEKDRRQLAPDSKPSVKKYRTRFSPKQKLELENAFYRTPYPSATLRAQLANSLGVTPSVVMVRKLLFGMYMTRSRLSNRSWNDLIKNPGILWTMECSQGRVVPFLSLFYFLFSHPFWCLKTQGQQIGMGYLREKYGRKYQDIMLEKLLGVLHLPKHLQMYFELSIHFWLVRKRSDAY